MSRRRPIWVDMVADAIAAIVMGMALAVVFAYGPGGALS